MFKIRNNVIREKINIKNSVLEYIRYKQFIWHDHVQRADEERLPWNIFEWCPLGRRRRRKKRKASKFVDAGGYNRNEREFLIPPM